MNLLQEIIGFFFAIFLLVLVHEYGHYLAARFFKVKVLKFSIGFGKPFYKWYGKKSKVEFCIAPILIGGYVKMLDSREEKIKAEELPLAFDSKPILARAGIIFAGPFANILFAFIAFWLMFVIGIKVPKPIVGKVAPNSIASVAGMRAGEEIITVDKRDTPGWKDVFVAMFARIGDKGDLQITARRSPLDAGNKYKLDLSKWNINQLRPDPLEDFGLTPYHPLTNAIIGKLVKDSPADHAGLKVGDKIIAIDNMKMHDWDEVIDYLRDRPEQKIMLKILRGAKTQEIATTSGWKYGAGWKKIGFLGMQSQVVGWQESDLREQKFSLFNAWRPAVDEMWSLVSLNGIVLAKLFTGKISLRVLGGPLSIYEASSHALEQGTVMFIGFLALISLTLALINLFPLPGLDGGYFIFLLIEAILRRPVSLAMQILIIRLGMIALMVLFLQAMINDVMRVF